MPKSWNYSKGDARNIKAIHRRFGTRFVKSFPFISSLKRRFYEEFRGIKIVEILNYVDYKKSKAIKILEEQFGWENYGWKHFESIFTRFYQAYILPKKFGIDKRRAHLSDLICSGQITRGEALTEMEKVPYPTELLENDIKYVINKLRFSKEEFEEIMRIQPRSHLDFPHEGQFLPLLKFAKIII